MSRTLRVAAGIVAVLATAVGTVVALARSSLITDEMAKLMLVALLGLCVGFGFLIVVYRGVQKLD